MFLVKRDSVRGTHCVPSLPAVLPGRRRHTLSLPRACPVHRDPWDHSQDMPAADQPHRPEQLPSCKWAPPTPTLCGTLHFPGEGLPHQEGCGPSAPGLLPAGTPEQGGSVALGDRQRPPPSAQPPRSRMLFPAGSEPTR